MMASALIDTKSNTNITNLQCRTCLSVGIDLHNIFESSDSKLPHNLLKMLLNCTNIKISKRDSLPKSICGKCKLKLCQSYSFRLQCDNSDATLRQQQLFLNTSCLSTDLKLDYSNDCDALSDMKNEIGMIEYDRREQDVNTKEKEIESLALSDMKNEIEYDRRKQEVNTNEKEIKSLNQLDTITIDPLCVREESPVNEIDRDDTDTETDSDSSEKIISTIIANNLKEKSPKYRKRELTSDEMDEDYGKKKIRVRCKYCKKSFCHANSLKSHLKKFHSYIVEKEKADAVRKEKSEKAGDKPDPDLDCKYCGRHFTKSMALNLHKRVHERVHKPGYTKFRHQCTYCGKLFKRLGNCYEHQRTHTKERPHQCPHCPKTYAQRKSLTHHLIKHSKEQYVVCITCGKRLASKGSLAAHMLQHNGVKRHKCNECDKAFFYKSLLLVHMRQHTGERPYSCPFCEQVFATTTDLKNHKRRHTGDKRQQCQLCTKKFSTSSALKKHIWSHNEGNLLSCDICNDKFCSDEDFKTHLNSHS